MRVFDYDDYNWRKGICIEVDSEAAAIIANCLKDEIKKAANAEDYSKISELIASLKIINDASEALKEKEESSQEGGRG